jgi:hypothetical protein
VCHRDRLLTTLKTPLKRRESRFTVIGRGQCGARASGWSQCRARPVVQLECYRLRQVRVAAAHPVPYCVAPTRPAACVVSSSSRWQAACLAPSR